MGSRVGQGVLNVKLKGRVHPLTGHEKPKGAGWRCVLKSTPQLLYPPTPCKRSGTHCGPHGQSGRVQKISPAPGYDPSTVSP